MGVGGSPPNCSLGDREAEWKLYPGYRADFCQPMPKWLCCSACGREVHHGREVGADWCVNVCFRNMVFYGQKVREDQEGLEFYYPLQERRRPLAGSFPHETPSFNISTISFNMGLWRIFQIHTIVITPGYFRYLEE